ncbi:MAG TPA: bifunctional phosphoribosylaminoimidazolecarboxamide formyltransferase/IMP cyclohydrolase, partial [Magnetospirillaceae bacterium]|nr:bifunctional phosphoribosylaminoimidazolecarboxamide formyltransferase/IMP cyclohydrolase [Magnetospirillaceae bacterium]
DDLVQVKNAIISVHDKSGIEELARGLSRACPDIRIYSTGGTYAALKAALGPGSDRMLVPMERYTGQPEMKGGLVKTLDWRIYLGILSEPYDADHDSDRERAGAVAFDLVVGNLYPFEALSGIPGSFENLRQHVDIGGPCMLRAAAKNFLRVAAVCDPRDYPAVLDDLGRTGGKLGLELRARLSRKVFETTSLYDAAIAAFLASRPAAGLEAEYEIRRGF